MRRFALAIVGLASACGEAKERPPVADRAPPPGLTGAEARERFCATVFDRGSVARIAGLDNLGVLPSTRPLELGVGECIYGVGPGATVALVVDCRPEHPQRSSTRASLEGQVGFRDVDVGAGGVYTRDDQLDLHRLVFFSEQPSCAVYLSTTGVIDDLTEPLARHAAARLVPGSLQPR